MTADDFPAFHIPIGHTRGDDGEPVIWACDADSAACVGRLIDRLERHPRAIAAGGYLMIGPTITYRFVFAARMAFKSPTPEGAWFPSAMSDVDDAFQRWRAS
jgi:hypothetical protein